ncbi:MAG: hypothetical protein GXP25_20840, partial [Planctomycetes bacterium]|nr:hypothetical protein [Planctomycetota bacterium]
MAKYTGPICAVCGVKACSAEPGTKELPLLCPMLAEAGALEEAERVYHEQDDVHRLAVESARTESAGYGKST